MIDKVAMKSKRIIFPVELQPQAREKLHGNQMDIGKTILLTRGSIHWVNMNADTEIAI